MNKQNEFARLISMMSDRPKTFCVITYGCQMNAHDGEKIAGILSSMDITEAVREDADLVIVNTCCVRENAERKALGNVKYLAHRHKDNPRFLLGVCGCMVQENKDAGEAKRMFPEADFLIGTHNLHALPEVLYNAIITGGATVSVSADDRAPIAEGVPAIRENRHKAFVNIMYGCDNFCSYCIVPYVRGRERSREPGAILREIEGLLETGCKEITLLGQNVNSYGKNLSQEISFAKLLHKIDALSVPRVRFMTSHPKDLSDELIEAMSSLQSLCKHIHLPVQSGSDRVLSLMNRRYTREDYLNKLRRLRAAASNICVTTDLIVGFPTETEQDFEDTLSLVEEADFAAAYTFIYSPRKGTKAAAMDGQIPAEVSSRRIERLIAVQEAHTRAILGAQIGSVQTVLVDEVSRRSASHVSGKTEAGISVSFAGSAELIGRFVNVQITSAGHNTLRGSIAF
jgi:tRNA-2-methylthio-N6-dimethylallyladenosine synthase